MKIKGIYHEDFIREREDLVSHLLIDPMASRSRVGYLRRHYARTRVKAQRAIAEDGIKQAIEQEVVTPADLVEILNNPDALLRLHEQIYCAPEMAKAWRDLLEAELADYPPPPIPRFTQPPTLPYPAAEQSPDRLRVANGDETAVAGDVTVPPEAELADYPPPPILPEPASPESGPFIIPIGPRRKLFEFSASKKAAVVLLAAMTLAMTLAGYRAYAAGMENADLRHRAYVAGKENADLRARMKRLISGLGEWGGLDEPQEGFRVSGARKDKIEVRGWIDPAFIREVRVQIGHAGKMVVRTIYQGSDQADLGSPLQKEFSWSSDPWTLDGTPLIASLQYIPYPEMTTRYPVFFHEDQLLWTRQFLLSDSGIKRQAEFVSIESPVANAQLPREIEVVGRLKIEGYPIVFARPLVPGGAWWVQSPLVEAGDNKQFRAHATLGDLSTPIGMHYNLAVVVAPSREAAEELAKSATRTTLPPGLPQSNILDVERVR